MQQHNKQKQQVKVQSSMKNRRAIKNLLQNVFFFAYFCEHPFMIVFDQEKVASEFDDSGNGPDPPTARAPKRNRPIWGGCGDTRCETTIKRLRLCRDREGRRLRGEREDLKGQVEDLAAERDALAHQCEELKMDIAFQKEDYEKQLQTEITNLR